MRIAGKIYFFVTWLVLVAGIKKSTAQLVHYCRENVQIINSDDIQLVPDISGTYHLLTFTRNEPPGVFIYNQKLELIAKTKLPFVYPDRAQYRIIPFKNFYYLSVYIMYRREYKFWKIDAQGNCTDFTEAFQKLLASQAASFKIGFQLIPYQDGLWMVYHTGITNPEKNTVAMIKTDSLLQPVFMHKVMYDFKPDEDVLIQEALIFDRFLIVLKSTQSRSALELMKVNLATGFTIRNTFRSSGYIYSQSGFSYNDDDTTVTVTSLLTEPGFTTNPKQYVFISWLNKILVEKTPLAILKTQFKKNTNTNFVMVNGKSLWVRFKKGRGGTSVSVQKNPITVYEDLINKTEASQSTAEINSMLARMDGGYAGTAYSDEVGVRFSLLNTNLEIKSDSLVKNTKDSYTIKADQYTRFEMDGKEHLLVAQQFFTRKNGLLDVSADDTEKLQYKFLKVNEKYKYLIAKSKNIPHNGIIVPYTRRNEVGFIKITKE
jgi:hypothetical protein